MKELKELEIRTLLLMHTQTLKDPKQIEGIKRDWDQNSFPHADTNFGKPYGNGRN